MGFKKVIATVLAATMLISSAVSVSAATGSPRNYDKNPYIDVNSKLHTQTIVTSVVTNAGATVEKVAKKSTATKRTVTIKNAHNADSQLVPIIAIKSKTKFANYVKKMVIKSSEQVQLNSYAFKNSKIKTIYLSGSKSKSAWFKKNSLKKSKVTKIYITTKAAAINLKVSSGVGKKVKVYVKASVYKKLSRSQKSKLGTKVKRLTGSKTINTYN